MSTSGAEVYDGCSDTFTMIREGTYIFSAPDDAQALIDAKAYIEDNGWTKDDVKITRREGQLNVIAKRNLCQ